MHSSHDPDVKEFLKKNGQEQLSFLKEEMFGNQMLGHPVEPLSEDEKEVCEYLCKALKGGETLRNFCYLFLTNDPQCNEEAVSKLKEGFRGIV